MALYGPVVSNRNVFLDNQTDHSGLNTSCIHKCDSFPITVAIGIVVSLGGVFLLLASYHILPSGMNAISGMGTWGQVLGYGTVGLGLVTIAISLVRRCAIPLHSQEQLDAASSIDEGSIEAQTREAQRLAAITIQKQWRGYLTRKQIGEVKKQESATTIQSFIRMHRVHKLYEQEKAHELDDALFEGAKRYTEDPMKLAGAPRAPQGATKHKIYMPQELAVVIRACQDEKDSSRFPKLEQAHAICSENKLRYIDVPKARLEGGFIVEEKLPDENTSPIRGMTFYYQNHEHYTEAVKEFTSFLCYGSLDDVVGGSNDMLNYLKISRVPRFDNLLLYSTEHEEKKLYKIGIVDFGTFKLNSSEPTFWNVYQALSSAVRLFPYHFDVIIERGKTFCNISQGTIEELHTESLKSRQLYKIVCEDNLTFYQKHHITLQNPQIMVALTPERREELKKHMGAFVRTMHEDDPNCLNGDPDASVERFQEELCPQMLSLIEEEFNTILSRSSKTTPLINDGELIERRMIGADVTFRLYSQFQNATFVEEVFKSKSSAIFPIFKEILNQFVKGGELSYYKPCVYSCDDLIFF